MSCVWARYMSQDVSADAHSVCGKPDMVRGTIKRHILYLIFGTSRVPLSVRPQLSPGCPKLFQENIRILPQIKLFTVDFSELSCHLARCCCSSTRHGLYGPGIQSRRWVRFSAPVQTGFGEHPASCKMVTGSLSWGKSGRRVALTTHLHLAPRITKEHSFPSTLPLELRRLFKDDLYLYL